MCGIAGFWDNSGIAGEGILEKMLHTLAHRGPDDRGTYQNGNITLGHTRLSILDLSPLGRNPMHSPNRRYSIIHNGEVYNYKELKRELQGYPFSTETDTEVILAAYLEWGPRCLEKFIGMYSFVIWDKEKQILFGARDRFGIKPFYYFRKDGSFYFASEIKALLAAGHMPKPNMNIIRDYLENGYLDHSEETFFSGIFKLPPAHYFLLQGPSLKINKYWDLMAFEAEESLSAQTLKSSTLELLESAVELSLRSDVNVGVNLSGGLDSSCLISLMNERWTNSYSLKGFSQDFADPRFSEKLWVEEMRTWVEKDFFYSVTTPELVQECAERMVWQQDEPFAGVPVIGYAGLYQNTLDQNTSVLLDGNGMDEAFGGYQTYHKAYLGEMARQNPKSRETLQVLYNKEWGVPLRETPSIAGGEHQDGTASTRPQWLSRDFLKGTSITGESLGLGIRSPVKRRMYNDACFLKVPRALRFNDRISMAYSRELRVPFLDHRLFEFTFALSEQQLFWDNRPKGLLRMAFAGRVPANILKAPKRQIQTPQSQWLNGELRGWVGEILSSSSFKERGVYDSQQVLKDFGNVRGKPLANSNYIWQAVNLELWFRMFIDALPSMDPNKSFLRF